MAKTSSFVILLTKIPFSGKERPTLPAVESLLYLLFLDILHKTTWLFSALEW